MVKGTHPRWWHRKTLDSPPTDTPNLYLHIEQSLREWNDLGEWHWNMYNIIYEMNCQSRFDAGYRMLGAGALGWPRRMVCGGKWEGGSGWGTRVYPWWIHVNVWQNQHNIVKQLSFNFKINKLPVQVRCRIQDAWGWCTGMTQRDGMGREVGGGFRMGNTCTLVVDSCQCMAKPIQYCKVISLQLK